MGMFWLGKKHGSAMVESSIVMVLLCLILFGILQVSYLVASHNVINYTAYATARAASVGLNDFMLYKVSHYTSIPVAGPITTPSGFAENRPSGTSAGGLWDNAIAREHAPVSELGIYEISVKEAYHMANPSVFDSILNYENWQSAETGIRFEYESDTDDLLTLRVEQTIPLVFPFSRVFFGYLDPVAARRGGTVGMYPGKRISSTVVIEDHSKLYLRDD